MPLHQEKSPHQLTARAWHKNGPQKCWRILVFLSKYGELELVKFEYITVQKGRVYSRFIKVHSQIKKTKKQPVLNDYIFHFNQGNL